MRILRVVDEHPELTDDIAFETTPHGIVAVSPERPEHGDIVAELLSQLRAGLDAKEATDVRVANEGGFVTAGYRKVPDLYVQHRESAAPFEHGYLQGVGGVWLFVEVTSPSTRAIDLGLTDPVVDPGKPATYAAAGVPLYLVIDRLKGRVLLYSEPTDGSYPAAAVYSVGEKVWLPKPFGFPLDTEPLKAFM